MTDENLGEIRVEVGEEIIVPVTSTRKIKAKVTGLMDNDEKEEIRIIAVPTEIQELGPSFNFSLSVNEYKEFRGDLSHLENVNLHKKGQQQNLCKFLVVKLDSQKQIN